MNAKDLMIDDIVRVAKDVCIPKGTVVSIKGIDADNCFREKHLVGCATCLPIIDEYRNTYGVWVEYLEPIPLTPNILKKIGFELQDGWYRPFRKIGEDEIAIRLPKKGDMYQYTEFEYSKLCYNHEDVTESEYDCSMTIKGVANLHELQHFMRFCGIEKEIEL